MGSMIDFKRPDGSTCKGYLAEAGSGKPGIVVIQEWWGLNDQIKGVADRFAAAGYNALAPDLYQGRVTQKPDEANHMMSGLDFVGASDQDIAGAVRHLAATSRKVGVMGFCLGGLLSFLTAARIGADAAIAYYPGNADKYLGEAPQIGTPLLVHLAEEDEYIAKPAQALITDALARRPTARTFSYAGCSHAFARHGGAHHDAGAAILANGRSADFLARHLK